MDFLDDFVCDLQCEDLYNDYVWDVDEDSSSTVSTPRATYSAYFNF